MVKKGRREDGKAERECGGERRGGVGRGKNIHIASPFLPLSLPRLTLYLTSSGEQSKLMGCSVTVFSASTMNWEGSRKRRREGERKGKREGGEREGGRDGGTEESDAGKSIKAHHTSHN